MTKIKNKELAIWIIDRERIKVIPYFLVRVIECEIAQLFHISCQYLEF